MNRGRVAFLAQFPSLTDDRVIRGLASPSAHGTFAACKLDFADRERHGEAYALHCDLLALRRGDPVLSRAGTHRPEGAVLGAGACVLRYTDTEHGDRLLVLNLDRDLDFASAPEPLLAPPAGNQRWRLVWSSEALQYGGAGVRPLDTDGPWLIPGGSAMFFVPEPR